MIVARVGVQEGQEFLRSRLRWQGIAGGLQGEGCRRLQGVAGLSGVGFFLLMVDFYRNEDFELPFICGDLGVCFKVHANSDETVFWFPRCIYYNE